MFGRGNSPERMTDKSNNKSVEDDDLENLSQLPHKDGKDVKPKYGPPIINICDLIIKSEDSWTDLVDAVDIKEEKAQQH